MDDDHGRFVWYELITTDLVATEVFYTSVVGWGAQDASTADLGYTLFTVGKEPVSGLMRLPDEARKLGATPRWMGYVGVDDVNITADQFKHLGGAVFVPPTDSNIGRISVCADPQAATLALVRELKPGRRPRTELGKPGHVGWHELFAADCDRAFDFYAGVFGWKKVDSQRGSAERYQLFSAGGQTIGGMLTKPPTDPVPYWLFYFNVDDIDAAVERVKAGGGRLFEGPLELPGDSWIARCADPQGAAFALQGTRRQRGIGWSSQWDGISSRGRLIG